MKYKEYTSKEEIKQIEAICSKLGVKDLEEFDNDITSEDDEEVFYTIKYIAETFITKSYKDALAVHKTFSTESEEPTKEELLYSIVDLIEGCFALNCSESMLIKKIQNSLAY